MRRFSDHLVIRPVCLRGELQRIQREVIANVRGDCKESIPCRLSRASAFFVMTPLARTRLFRAPRIRRLAQAERHPLEECRAE